MAVMECFCVDFALVQQVAPLFFQWPLVQPFPEALAGGVCLCSVYLT
jgi:hypothetical protein